MTQKEQRLVQEISEDIKRRLAGRQLSPEASLDIVTVVIREVLMVRKK